MDANGTRRIAETAHEADEVNTAFGGLRNTLAQMLVYDLGVTLLAAKVGGWPLAVCLAVAVVVALGLVLLLGYFERDRRYRLGRFVDPLSGKISIPNGTPLSWKPAIRHGILVAALFAVTISLL